jgi:hypothetical protein
MARHFVSYACRDERCRVCGADATHRVMEVLDRDDPEYDRPTLTACVCCHCFAALMGPVLPCGNQNQGGT